MRDSKSGGNTSLQALTASLSQRVGSVVFRYLVDEVAQVVESGCSVDDVAIQGGALDLASEDQRGAAGRTIWVSGGQISPKCWRARSSSLRRIGLRMR
jgi:hypothetical protein